MAISALTVGALSMAVAVEAWDADLDAQNGEGLVWAQVARAGNWVTAQLPKQAAAVARPKQPPRKPAPADRVDRTRVGYALETLGAGRTRAIFTVPDGAEELLAKYPIYCNNSAFDVKARGEARRNRARGGLGRRADEFGR